MMFCRDERWRCVLVVVLLGALLSLAVFGSGTAACLMYVPLVLFTLAVSWRGRDEQIAIRALDPLFSIASPRAPPTC